jgi:DNA-binding transcriptional LysR family regulator
MGARLFERTSRRVALTDSGARLRERIAPLFEQMAGVLREVQVANGHYVGSLRIGVFSGVAAGPHFPAIVRAFESRHPDWSAEVGDIPLGGSLVGLLVRGEADLLATWLPDSEGDLGDLVLGPSLLREPRVLAVGPGHPLAGRPAVSVEEIADYPVVQQGWIPAELRDLWLPAKTPRGRSFRHHEVDDRDRGRLLSELGYLVASGKIVHPTVPSLTRLFGHLDIVYVPIIDLPPFRSGLVWRQGTKDARVHEFARVAEEIVGADSAGATAEPSHAGEAVTTPQ